MDSLPRSLTGAEPGSRTRVPFVDFRSVAMTIVPC